MTGITGTFGRAPAGGDSSVVFAVVEKRARVPWTPIGRLVLDLPMPDGAEDDGPDGTESVTFDPIVNAHPRLRPVRPLAAIRVAAIGCAFLRPGMSSGAHERMTEASSLYSRPAKSGWSFSAS